MTPAVLALGSVSLAVLALVIPGAALLAVLGVRDGRLLTAAPAATCVPLMAATAVLHLCHIAWRPLAAVAAMAVVVLLLGLAVRAASRPAAHGAGDAPSGRLSRPGGSRYRDARVQVARLWDRSFGGVPILERSATVHRRAPRLDLAAALTMVSLVVIGIPALRGMGGITTLNGSFDAFFHYSALQTVREGADAFPFTALAPMYGGRAAFYPTAWHALTALLPGDVVTVSNAMALAMLVLLPVTVYGVTCRCALPYAGARGPVLAAVVALCTTLFMSPAALSLVSGLWPFALGVLTLPVGAAALLGSSSWSVRAVALAGTMLAHPSTGFSLLVVIGAVCCAQLLRTLFVRRELLRALLWSVPLAAILVLFLVVVPLKFGEMQLTGADPSTLRSTVLVALLDRPRIRAIPLSPQVMGPLLAIAVVGMIVSLRHHRWMGITALMIAVAGLLLTYSAQSDDLGWFGRISSVWYGARERVQPLMLLGTVMLATIGATALPEMLERLAPRRGAPDSAARRRRLRSATAALTAAGLLASVLASAVLPTRLQRTASLAYTAYGLQFLPYAPPEEVAFIRASGARLPERAVVLGSPLDGTSLYYALDGVDVVYPSLANAQSMQQRRIGRYADELDAPGSLACRAMREEGVTHVYRDLSAYRGGALFPERTIKDFGGIARIPASHLTVVAREGPYVLYAIDLPC